MIDHVFKIKKQTLYSTHFNKHFAPFKIETAGTKFTYLRFKNKAGSIGRHHRIQTTISLLYPFEDFDMNIYYPAHLVLSALFDPAHVEEFFRKVLEKEYISI